MLTLLTLPLTAQTPFLEVQSAAQAQFSTATLVRYAALLDTHFSKDVTIVSMGDVRDYQEDGILKFFWPGSTDTVVAEAIQIEDDSRVGFTWNAKFVNEPGYLSLNYKNGRTTGFMFKGTDFYELIPAENGKQFLVKRDKSGAGCGVEPEVTTPPNLTEEPGPNCPYEDSYNTCPAVISVLVIVTPQAATLINDTYGSLDDYIRGKEALINMALQNSDIPNKSVRLTHIIKGGFTGLQDPSVLPLLRTWASPDRDEYRADLVILLCDVFKPTAAGVANSPFNPDPEKAFAVVEVSAGDKVGAFPHEFGHLFGCRHNWTYNGGDDDTHICAHGYRHTLLHPPVPDPGEIGTGESYRTLVSKPEFNDATFILFDEGNAYEVTTAWIPHFSNPDVHYGGWIPTGVGTGYVADNAEQIRRNGCGVAAYRGGEELAVFPSFLPYGCQHNTPITFTANIVEPDAGIPGVGPYTVTWRWNKTGIFHTSGNNSTLMGTGTSVTIPEHPECPSYWVQCKVVSSDGVTISKVLKVVRGIICDCYDPAPGDDRNSALGAVTSLYPNPIQAGEVLNLPHPYSWLSITDTHGRSIYEASSMSQVWQVPLSLPAGLYFVRVGHADDPVAEVHKLFIINTH
ncbi:MAG TPA: T9SS type A sorting domain-containing protein [Saprospiraceae bacterium]|nr:T9SS type A sorting domain-containing protein [Saprospiraceae bacterium]